MKEIRFNHVCVLNLFLLSISCTLAANMMKENGNHYHQFNSLYQSIESKHTRTSLLKLRNYLSNNSLCEHIYLDVGTNIGIQIRKLYEPHLYPNSAVFPFFKEYFGGESDWKNVCAIGFEPNYKWTERLTNLQNVYRHLGYPVIIFTETAVNINSKNMTFYTEPYEKPKNHEWGSSLIRWNDRMDTVSTGSISLASLLEIINLRAGKTLDSKVFMKLDVEGAEYIILPDLLLTGAICHVNSIACEFHPAFNKIKAPTPTELMATINWILKNKANCPSQLIALDDETYGDSNHPLPTIL